MSFVFQGGSPKLLTSSGTICDRPGVLLGFYVASTSGGTIVLNDNATAVSGTITPAVGYHSFPCGFGTSIKATIGGTISVTFFYMPAK